MTSPVARACVLTILCLAVLWSRVQAAATGVADTASVAPAFALAGYAAMNYYGFRWDTDPSRRNVIDMERLVLVPSVRVSPTIRAVSEIEIEHGGTGSTMEFDRFEEFGEYEAEIEKGGAVKIERLFIEIAFSTHAVLRIGRIVLPVGQLAANDEPHEYFTTLRSELETTLIPSPWPENGVGLSGTIPGVGALTYQLLVVNGLDATGFSSANWIRRGHQTRFEMVNADNLATVVSCDLQIAAETRIGASAYFGNSSDNRPKPDLTVPAHVTVLELHGSAAWEGLVVRAMGLYGTLQNADLVSAANRNLSNNLNAKRTPVGSAAAGYFVEAGYRIPAPFLAPPALLTPFIRWEYYDSMAGVSGEVFDNPRWERRVLTGGVNLTPLPGFIVKAQYSLRKLGIPVLNEERTFSLGVGMTVD